MYTDRLQCVLVSFKSVTVIQPHEFNYKEKIKKESKAMIFPRSCQHHSQLFTSRRLTCASLPPFNYFPFLQQQNEPAQTLLSLVNVNMTTAKVS